MSGAELKCDGINQVSSHNPATLEQVLREIDATRRCRLRMEKTYDEVFTVEQLILDVQRRVGLPIPHSLNGAIGHHSRRRGLIDGTGRLTKSDRDERRDNKVEECRWGLY